jgi:hypothetical protein
MWINAGEDAMARIARLICLLCLLIASAAPATATGLSDALDRGPKVGQTIPHTLKAPDQTDQYQEFKSLARKLGLIVLFSRSVGW